MRPLSSATQTAVAGPVTQPIYLVLLGFDTPVRLSSRGVVDYDSATWLEASFELSDDTLRIFNESAQIGQIVLTEGTAGRSVKVYQFYDAADVLLQFDGEMGEARIGEFVDITLKRRPPNRTPRDFVNEPVFSHLPAPGTRIVTPKQTIVIE